METPPFATSVDSVAFGHTSIRRSFRAVNSVPVRQLLTASRMEPLPSVTPKIRSHLDLLPSASVLGKTSHMETLPSATLNNRSLLEPPPSVSSFVTSSRMETLPSATLYIPPHRRHSP